jgi:hypothetical protein
METPVPSAAKLPFSSMCSSPCASLHLSTSAPVVDEQVDRRIRMMKAAFPEALTAVPPGLINGIEGLPDPNDRHVVGLAIQAHAKIIVTDNVRDFPDEARSHHNLTVLSADKASWH